MAEEKLVRGISRWTMVAIVINSIIGAGIFGLPSKVAALIGSIIGGRLGDTRPFATRVTTAAVTVVASAGLCAFSTLPVPTLVLFTLLGLVGLSTNPMLVNHAVRYGGHAPTLASAMATSIFNLGTAVGA